MSLIHRRDLLKYVGDAKKIVDVGSGHKPFPLATCIVDKSPDSYKHGERVHTENPGGRVEKPRDKKFVDAELPKLPFADLEFDFVYCSHVIEHVEDIGAALRELARIAPRGYVECPRAWFEYVDCTPFHRWIIDFDGKELVAKPKTPDEMRWCLDRRLIDRDKKLFHRLYRSDEANIIAGLDQRSSWSRMKARVRSTITPGRYPPLTTQLENKAHIALCLYFEGSIPYRIVPPSQSLTPPALAPKHS